MIVAANASVHSLNNSRFLVPIQCILLRSSEVIKPRKYYRGKMLKIQFKLTFNGSEFVRDNLGTKCFSVSVFAI